MSWFERLTGFTEQSPQQVRSQLKLEGSRLFSLVNGKSWDCGFFAAPMLHDLRAYDYDLTKINQEHKVPRLQVHELVADVTKLHADPSNADAIFQVASQFNLLEMASCNITPEHGVGIYEHDKTQGPACAIACGAGTIWRNYFMPLGQQIGQDANQQFDALSELGKQLGNENNKLWQMTNGYALARREGLVQISQQLGNADDAKQQSLAGFIRIGIQGNTQVTLPGCEHSVTQLYCSALPVAYSNHPIELWEDFAKLVLDAAYEATFFYALQHQKPEQRGKLFLTLLGGGAFGNKTEWIIDAIRKNLLKFAALDLDVYIVSYMYSKPEVRGLVEEFTAQFNQQKQAELDNFVKPKVLPEPTEEELLLQKRTLLSQIIEAYEPLSHLLEKAEEFLICPTCNKDYMHWGVKLDTIEVLRRIQFMTGYNFKREEGKVAMPVCYDCQTHIIEQHPFSEGDDSLDLILNGYKVRRRAKFGGVIHWVHV